MSALRESVLRLWSEEGPWALTLGSRRLLMSLVRQRFFIKDLDPSEPAPVNQWGVYQAVRWVQVLAVGAGARERAGVVRVPRPCLLAGGCSGSLSS